MKTLDGPLPGMKFVTIPSGSFLMGSNNFGEDERPVHQVTIKAFQMMTTPVTQGMWKDLMGYNPSKFENVNLMDYSHSKFDGDNLPVENVSWLDCQNFILELNRLDLDGEYRLPSEAEWEYACRTGSTTNSFGGDDASDFVRVEWSTGKKTNPVGNVQPNAWGLYDMLGNVLEWCEDAWHFSYILAPTDGSVWTDNHSKRHVLRGKHLRSTQRSRSSLDYRSSEIGFRLVHVSHAESTSKLRKMEFVPIPGGSFQMGSNYGDEREEPVHIVTINPFQMMTTVVTNAMWQEVENNKIWKNKDGNLPYTFVSWEDCQKFIEKLNQRDPSKGYRLPSEAEWEYACRAGSTVNYCNGNNESDLARVGWYHGNSDEKVHSVAMKEPNAWGLYDMHGNVCEWCMDTRHDYYNGAPIDGSPWVDSRSEYRALRGGSWQYNSFACRSSDRNWGDPEYRYDEINGFRLVRKA